MKKNAKIIIVGAGPIGCYTAQLLKHAGYNPLLLEEHAQVGRPVSCAGIVGKGLFEELRLPLSRRSIQNTINGARVSYNGAAFDLHRQTVAYIVDRALFDQELSHKLEIEFNTTLQDIHPIREGYFLKTNNGEYFADLVIGADGPNSRVRKALGFNSDMKLYRGYQYRIKMTPERLDAVEVDYVKPFSLFTWLIPEGNGVARVGTICNNPYQELNRFLEKHKLTGEIIEKNAGAIPIGTCELVKGQAMLVGDAACQVKPITSGGIYYGLKAAEMLVDAVRDNNLAQYQTRWSEEFEQEIRICLLLRNILENMGEDVLKKMFEYVRDNSRLIEKIGDFENHSSVIWSLVSNPRTYPTIGALLMGLARNPRFLFRSLFRLPR
ncbi:MAG: NAD(P)/FAD-dependent oxidoreductase [Candidatus Margulisbacteria bacterium]|jgi:geranylgeranyl reductase family protein|nr:NAD(P)/FAD-dependent oxidoreductase [Candidatus Margulisiibacteriota bacterium]